MAPVSKSSLQRLLFASALASGPSLVSPRGDSRDIEAAINAIRFLGAKVESRPEGYFVVGTATPQGHGEVDVIESGSILRFLAPLALVSGEPCVIRGREGLARRPLGPYQQAFEGRVAEFSAPPGLSLPLSLRGPIKAGVFNLAGNVSSQFVTGLLFALPLLDGDSIIVMDTKLESMAYVELSLKVLSESGIVVERLGPDNNLPNGGFSVAGGQSYRPGPRRAEGDWSNAAFWLAAKALGHDVQVAGLDPGSAQADKIAAEIFRDSPSEINVRECPDLVPILCVWAGLCGHPVRIRGAERVRLKECDRVTAMANELNAVGAKVRELPDGLDIEPVESYQGGKVSSWNDHRVVMALAVASLRSRGDIIIEGAEAVRKSYPGFFDDWSCLGGKIDVQQ